MIIIRLAPLLLLAMAAEVPQYVKDLVNELEGQLNWYAITHNPAAVNSMREQLAYSYVSPFVYKGFATKWNCTNLSCGKKSCSDQRFQSHTFSQAFLELTHRRPIPLNVTEHTLFTKLKEHGIRNVMLAKDAVWDMKKSVGDSVNRTTVETQWSLFRGTDIVPCNTTVDIVEYKNVIPEYLRLSMECSCPWVNVN